MLPSPPANNQAPKEHATGGPEELKVYGLRRQLSPALLRQSAASSSASLISE
ncbi:UNVERIFIED_CONTAM: hypothetical protein Sradi_6967400, partial [Sesamum radiatum]